MATGSMRFYSVCRSGQTRFQYVIPNDLQPEMVQGNPHYGRIRCPAYGIGIPRNLRRMCGLGGRRETMKFVSFLLSVVRLKAG
ncbi:MAG: hypothetical protein K6G04_02105 [Lachnospiraceae bacterium]|nr:hypothetical protein [Lachnospiraceae bacterium]